MRKKIFKRASLAFFTIIFIWLIMAQSCMKFKISDSEAKKDFEKEGLVLTTKTVKISKRHIHYAQSGNDTLPTIVFFTWLSR